MSNSVEKQNLSEPIERFVLTRVSFYERAFTRIQEAEGFVLTWNTSAAICGPLWGSMGPLWGKNGQQS